MQERDERAWAAQWKDAALALEQQRWAELRSLSAAQALAATEALLTVAPPGALEGPRKTGSGLVEQQRLLMLARAVEPLLELKEAPESAARLPQLLDRHRV